MYTDAYPFLHYEMHTFATWVATRMMICHGLKRITDLDPLLRR